MRHRVFISYHHANDQRYKNELVRFGLENEIFVDIPFCFMQCGP